MAVFSKFLTITDNVHGTIEISLIVKMIIDTPEFQRLGELSQLGLSKKIYPTARHSRFEHSVGVSYLANNLLRSLQQAQPELGITDSDVLAVRLAALLHDLGHGPFSHSFENFIHTYNKAWTHEHTSTLLVDALFYGNPWDSADAKQHREELRQETTKMCDNGDLAAFLDVVKELIDPPKDGNYKSELWQAYGPEKAFMYEIVSNPKTGFDVDKFDYFLRDSDATNVSVPFNHADLKRLFKFTRVHKVPVDNGSSVHRLVYAHKLLPTLESVGETRVRLHKTVYQHKTNVAFEILLAKALRRAHEGGFKLRGADRKNYSLVEAAENMAGFINLTDSVRSLIINHDAEEGSDIEEAQRILTDDFNLRQQPKIVCRALNNVPIQYKRGVHEGGQAEATEGGPNILYDIAKDSESDYLSPSGCTIPFHNLTAIVSEIHAGKMDKNPLAECYFYEDGQDSTRVFKYEPEGVEVNKVMIRPLFIYQTSTEGGSLSDGQRHYLSGLVSRRTKTPLKENKRVVLPLTPNDKDDNNDEGLGPTPAKRRVLN